MRKLLWASIFVIVMLCFNVVFFVILSYAPMVVPSIWWSYAFIHVAFLLVVAMPIFIRQEDKYYFDYERPILLGGVVFFCITLIVNMSFIIVSFNSVLSDLYINMPTSLKDDFMAWIIKHLSGHEGFLAAWLLKFLGTPVSIDATLITNVLLFGAITIYVIINTSVNRDISHHERQVQQELVYVRDGEVRLNEIYVLASEMECRNDVERLRNLIGSSPLHSNSNARPLEKRILKEIDNLEYACGTGNEEQALNVCQSLIRLATQRNIIVKTNKP